MVKALSFLSLSAAVAMLVTWFVCLGGCTLDGWRVLFHWAVALVFVLCFAYGRYGARRGQ